MTIDIKYSQSEPNRLTKQVKHVKRLEGTLRANSTVINPSIMVEGDLTEVSNANYLTIYEFRRNYFITNFESVRNGIFIINAHVDVLSTFATDIKANTAIVKRQANTFNLYLDDGAFKVYQNPIVETFKFPQGFAGHMFVLTVMG